MSGRNDGNSAGDDDIAETGAVPFEVAAPALAASADAPASIAIGSTRLASTPLSLWPGNTLDGPLQRIHRFVTENWSARIEP